MYSWVLPRFIASFANYTGSYKTITTLLGHMYYSKCSGYAHVQSKRLHSIQCNAHQINSVLYCHF